MKAGLLGTEISVCGKTLVVSEPEKATLCYGCAIFEKEISANCTAVCDQLGSLCSTEDFIYRLKKEETEL